MRTASSVLLVLAAVSFVVGLVSRVSVTPLPFFGGVEADALLRFTNTCLFFSIALTLLEAAKRKS